MFRYDLRISDTLKAMHSLHIKEVNVVLGMSCCCIQSIRREIKTIAVSNVILCKYLFIAEQCSPHEWGVQIRGVSVVPRSHTDDGT
jgi:hypothetical protein